MMRCVKRLPKLSFSVKITLVGLIICYYFGLFTMTLEKSYNELDIHLIPNISNYIRQLERNMTTSVHPINYYNYTFITNSYEKCDPNGEDYPLRVVFIVKSATGNFDRREAIRKTWGFEKRFSDVSIKTIFVLGLPSDEKIQFKINEESKKNKDIVQASFIDSYFNNTIKTMMGIKWAVTYCSDSKFYFFSDDDMYVSTKNVLKFLRNPLEYPQYLEVPFVNAHRTKVRSEALNKWPLGQVLDIELPSDAELFAGFMFPYSRPHRHFSSKWYVSLQEYPFSRYPPYITAGAYVLSKAALKKIYYASFFVKHFRFDDIYLALLAKACNIVPVHNDEFYFYKKPYNVFDYKYVVASHGYSDPDELIKAWNEQKSAGNA